MLTPKSEMTIEQVANGFVVIPGPSYRQAGSMEHSWLDATMVFNTVSQLNTFIAQHFDASPGSPSKIDREWKLVVTLTNRHNNESSVREFNETSPTALEAFLKLQRMKLWTEQWYVKTWAATEVKP